MGTEYLTLTAGGLVLPIAVAVPDEIPEGAIEINAAWLTTNGPAPYILDTASGYYYLTTDVTTDDTAFVVGAAGMTLDLNSHAVTYNNRASVDVANGCWDGAGVGEAPPNWDLTNAPGASVIANDVFAASCTQILKFTSIETTQYIDSDPVAITSYPHKLVAMSWIKGPTSGVVVTTQLLNSDTDAVLATWTHNTLGTGFATDGSTPCNYNVTESINVKVRITVTPTGAQTVRIGQVYMAYSQDHGIVASPSAHYYPVQMGSGTDAYVNGPNVGAFTLKNGSLTQGAGAGHFSHAVYALSLNHLLTIDGVVISCNGVDSDCIYGKWANYGVITDNTLNAGDIQNITNRMHHGSVICYGGSAPNLASLVTITGNTLNGCPRMGINVYNAKNVTIQNNAITPDTLVTEGYAIALGAIVDGDVSYNTISTTTSGRGIFLDGLFAHGAATNGLDIHHNSVDIQELPNYEYGNALQATALRLRSFIDKYVLNVDVYDNTFIARTDVNKVNGAYGARISLGINNDGEPIGVAIRDNTFEGIVDTDNSSFNGCGFDNGQTGVGTDVTLTGNTFSSNHYSLMFSSNDTSNFSRDSIYLSNTCHKSSEGTARTHISVRGSWWHFGAVNVSICDMRYTGGAVEGFSWEASEGENSIDYKWLADVHVYDSLTEADIVGASISLVDVDEVEVATGTTDADGLVSDIQVLVTAYAGTSPSVTGTPKTPHTLTVTKAGYTQYVDDSITLTVSGTIEVAMETA